MRIFFQIIERIDFSRRSGKDLVRLKVNTFRVNADHRPDFRVFSVSILFIYN